MRHVAVRDGKCAKFSIGVMQDVANVALERGRAARHDSRTAHTICARESTTGNATIARAAGRSESLSACTKQVKTGDSGA